MSGRKYLCPAIEPLLPHIMSDIEEKFISGPDINIQFYLIHQWLTIIQLTQQKMDREGKTILIMELASFSPWDPTKTKGKLGT